MALEAGVWGKAGWLALHSHLEGLLTLASVPQHLSSLPPLKSCIQCVESQLLDVIISVCQSVNLKMCVHVTCMHTHVCIFLGPSWVRTPLLALSPISCNCSVPQSERGDTLGCPLHLGCRARAILILRSVSLFSGFTESGSRLGGDGSCDYNGRVRGRLPFKSLESIL